MFKSESFMHMPFLILYISVEAKHKQQRFKDLVSKSFNQLSYVKFDNACKSFVNSFCSCSSLCMQHFKVGDHTRGAKL